MRQLFQLLTGKGMDINAGNPKVVILEWMCPLRLRLLQRAQSIWVPLLQQRDFLPERSKALVCKHVSVPPVKRE